MVKWPICGCGLFISAQQKPMPREVIFVIDNSGSMGGTSIIQAKASLIYALGRAPAEVEAVLEGHPDVQECAVYGVPDEHWGQRVVAAVVAVPDTPHLDDAAVIAYCRDRLAHYKCPTRIAVVSEIPRTATGKIQRGRLQKATAATQDHTS